jgi:hypothetical protein
VQTFHIVVRSTPARPAPSGVIHDAPRAPQRAPDGARAPPHAQQQPQQHRERRGFEIQWGLLANLALMVFLFSGGVWRNTIMITLACLIYLAQTGLLNLNFRLGAAAPAAPPAAPPRAAAGAAAAAAAAAPAQAGGGPVSLVGEVATFLFTLVVSLFPGYNPPVRAGAGAAPAPLDDEDPEEVLRRIDEVYERNQRDAAAAQEAEE